MKKKILSIIFSLALILGLFQTGIIIQEPIIIHGAENFISVTPAKLANREGFLDGVMNNPKSMNSGTITRVTNSDSATSAYFTFTLPERGIVTMRYSMKKDKSAIGTLNAYWTVYMDKALTNAVSKTVKVVGDAYEDTSFELNKGTYYVECAGDISAWSDYHPVNTVGISIGYVPVKTSALAFSAALSKTSTTTDDITVTVKTEDPDAEIYVLKGVQSEALLKNEYRWTEETRLCWQYKQ